MPREPPTPGRELVALRAQTTRTIWPPSIEKKRGKPEDPLRGPPDDRDTDRSDARENEGGIDEGT